MRLGRKGKERVTKKLLKKLRGVIDGPRGGWDAVGIGHLPSRRRAGTPEARSRVAVGESSSLVLFLCVVTSGSFLVGSFVVAYFVSGGNCIRDLACVVTSAVSAICLSSMQPPMDQPTA